MTDRSSKKSGASSREKSGASSGARQSQFFISGEGIDREVITTDICRYLGNDALVRPGTHQDKTGRVQEGFYITAYRAPTTAQLADLRADSAKWREERQRNTARTQGGYGYDQSATQQEAMRRGNIDEPRMQSGYPPTTFGQMSPPINQTMPPRQEYGTAQVQFRNANPPMQSQPASASYRSPGGYPPSESNYVYGAPPPNTGGYSVMDSSRDRMETAQSQPPWNMPPSSGYQPAGPPPSGTGYPPGRPTYSYSTVGGNPPVQAGYGRGESTGSYSDPYGPRDSGFSQPEQPGGDYYPDEEMDYEESPSTTPAPAPAPTRQREREKESRHDDPKRRHGHRS